MLYLFYLTPELMKQSDFKKYSDDRLRDIFKNLKSPRNYNKLPEEIQLFVLRENNVIGNESTRSMRCTLLIKEEMCVRFMNIKSK
jgi:hypothetical protein